MCGVLTEFVAFPMTSVKSMEDVYLLDMPFFGSLISSPHFAPMKSMGVCSRIYACT